KEVVNLEDLIQHTTKCKYNVDKNVKKCKKCFCEQKSGHDCIKSLLELNRKANEEIDALKRKPMATSPPVRQPAPQPPMPVVSAPVRPMSLFNTGGAASALREQQLMREINELKTEKMNFLKTIQDLSNTAPTVTPTNNTVINNNQRLSQPEPKPLFTSSSEISEQEIFNSCRKQLWSPEVLQNEMNKEVTQKLMTIVRAQIKEYNSIFVVCKNITEKLNEEFGHRWHCLADHKNGHKSYFTYEPGYLINIKFGLLFFEIYKTQFLSVQTMRQRFKSGKIKREIQILRTDMKQSMIADVKKITFAAVDKSDTLTAVSSEIKTQMEKRYPQHMWQCFIFGYFGVFGIHHTCGTFISFDVGQLTVTLFQANTS
ncbi:unnamed protein product, partial [Medioppia subpectinata]